MLQTIVSAVDADVLGAFGDGVADNGDGAVDARGHYTIGKELADTVTDKIRRVAGTLPPTV